MMCRIIDLFLVACAEYFYDKYLTLYFVLYRVYDKFRLGLLNEVQFFTK